MIAKQPDFINGLSDSSRAIADLAVVAIGNNKARFEEVLNICFNRPYPHNMRASRVVQLYCEKNPAFILPHLDKVIDAISTTRTGGVKRNFLKVLLESVDFTHISDNAALLDAIIEILIAKKDPVAIQYYALLLTEKYCKAEPELKNEIIPILENCMEESVSKGLSKRVQMIFKTL